MFASRRRTSKPKPFCPFVYEAQCAALTSTAVTARPEAAAARATVP